MGVAHRGVGRPDRRVTSIDVVVGPAERVDPMRPLVVLLHGFGSNERDLAGLAPHLPAAFGWVAPRAPSAVAPDGFAWFPITTPGRPDPASVRTAAEALLAWIDGHVPAETPVVPLGFSQGGLMAVQLLRARPDRFAAAVSLAGFVLDAEEPGDALLAMSRPPVFSGRGTADEVIARDAVARADAWLPAHSTLTTKTYPGLAHGIDGAELTDVVAFLDGVAGAANAGSAD